MARRSSTPAARPRRSFLAEAAPWLGFAALLALLAQPGRPPPSPPMSARRTGLSQPTLKPLARYEAEEPGRGRLAAAPWRIPWRGWRDILWRTWREVGDDRLNAVAGGVTFYVLLALFPGVGVFVSLYGLLFDVNEVSRQLNDLASFVPRQVLGLLGEQMVRLTSQREASLSIAFGVSLLLSIWSANAGMAALFDGLNVAYDEAERRNFVLRRAMTFSFTAAALVFVTAGVAIQVAAPLVLEGMGGPATWLVPLRWLVMAVLVAAAFAALYRFGPSRAPARWRWVTVGAVMAAVGWMGGSLVFSWYVNNLAHYDVTYGSLGTVIGFMMWIWFSAMTVLIGAEINAEIEHQTALDSTTGPPAPLGRRGAAMADTVGVAFAGVRKTWTNARTGLRKLRGGRERPG